MAEYREGQRLRGSDGNVYVIQGGIPVLDSPTSMGGVPIKQADPTRPYQGPKAAADATIANNKAAASGLDPAMAQQQLRALKLANDKAERENQQGNNGKGLTPEVRKDAIAGYNASAALQRQIDEIKAKFDAGPGKTKGIAGLRDYLSTTENLQFDEAGNAARALGGPVLGFTASQMNTEKEQARNMGPYIPQSSDRDAVIQDKINRLQGLVDLGKERSIQVLGGIPDAAGNIDRNAVPGAAPNVSPPPGGPPISGGIVPSGGPNAFPPTGGPPQLSLATGGSREEIDKDKSAQLEQMIRNGANAAEIDAALGTKVDQAQIDQVRAYLKQNPTYSGFGRVTNTVDNSIFSQMAASPMGAFTAGVADAVVPLNSIVSDEQRGKLDMLRQDNPGSTLMGNLIGGIPAVAAGEIGLARAGLGAWAPRVADAAYGGYQGAGNAEEGEGLYGGTVGALSGLAGGAAGRAIGRGVGRAARGVDSPAVQYLRGEDVPLTVGQALGGTAKQIEDQVTGYPFIGGIVKARRDEGLVGYNQAMMRQGAEGAPIQNIGERGAEELDQVVNQAYAPLNQYSAQVDPQLGVDLAGAIQRGQAIPGRGADFDHILNTRVAPNFDQSGVMSGANFQDSLRNLRVAGSNQGMAAMHADDFSGALGDVEGALTGLFARQAPDAVDTLEHGNRIYRNQSIIDQAVRAARNQRGPDGDALVMPSQLNAASVQNTTRFGGANRASTTDRPFYDLATHGQEILPSKVGDSGTAARLIIGGVPLALIGGGAAGGAASSENGLEGAGYGGAAGLATLGALVAAGGTRPSQRALVSMLAERSPEMREIGNRIFNYSARLGGPLGAPLLTGFSNQAFVQ